MYSMISEAFSAIYSMIFKAFPIIYSMIRAMIQASNAFWGSNKTMMPGSKALQAFPAYHIQHF